MDMDVALATVTAFSLSMAFAMGVVTWRLMREERRRSDARLVALMADLEQDRGRDVERVDRAARRTRDVPTAERVAPRRRAVPAKPAARAARPVGLFATMARSPGLRRPFLVTLSVATLVLAAWSFALLSPSTPADPGAGRSLPVELLSLAHAKKGDYLAITGSIRNPSGGIERGQLSVAATVFDRNGTVVGSGRTPLSVAALLPGRETPFSISLPDAERVNRFRISFLQDQTNVPHIDRRRLDDQARSAAPVSAGDQP